MDKEKIKCVALGVDDGGEFVEILQAQPQTPEDRIAALEARIMTMTKSIDALFAMVKATMDSGNKKGDADLKAIIDEKKKEGKSEIPEGTVLWGPTRGLNFFMTVQHGGFYVGTTRYDSPSAAAEAVSGVRRSGWAFWRLSDGKTLKEAFKNG